MLLYVRDEVQVYRDDVAPLTKYQPSGNTDTHTRETTLDCNFLIKGNIESERDGFQNH